MFSHENVCEKSFPWGRGCVGDKLRFVGFKLCEMAIPYEQLSFPFPTFVLQSEHGVRGFPSVLDTQKAIAMRGLLLLRQRNMMHFLGCCLLGSVDNLSPDNLQISNLWHS